MLGIGDRWERRGTRGATGLELLGGQSKPDRPAVGPAAPVAAWCARLARRSARLAGWSARLARRWSATPSTAGWPRARRGGRGLVGHDRQNRRGGGVAPNG